MKVFDNFIQNIKTDIKRFENKEYEVNKNSNWDKLKSSDLILQSDVGVELGHPKTKSASYIMWTNNDSIVCDNKITVIGQDLNEIKNSPIDYAKITLIKTKDYDEEKAYEIFQEMESLRLNINLKGYMLRATNQRNREWCRVSKEALKKGFSFNTLGSELINAYKEKDFVEEVEIIFIVGNKELINSISQVGLKVTEIIKALNTIFDDIDFDCHSCNFSDICDEIDGMKEMHGKKVQGKK
ncbi:hypothetical protein [Tepidibacter sp. Z1-5]|uniref:hypothetical protein n=1 Tax=Tepidibacter sp. Z1-5 TaxID=3134138 RepID=UPI0030C09EB3